MKLSIITPSHNLAFLKELEVTIIAQTHKDWQWVILLNGGAKYWSADPRIKIIDSPFKSDSVGLLKKYACMQAAGEVLVEVDHDDLLTSDCLEKVARAFEDPAVGFVYSDNAKLSDSFVPYNPALGWTYKKFNWHGKQLIAMNSQPAYPGRFGYVWFAPDHVRAWRKDVYELVGGHNDCLTVCDDIDLMHRTYMVTRFCYIPEVLYIYRITGNNTWLKKNKLIQDTTQKLYDEHIYSLAERWADNNCLLKIDLCGGFGKPAGYTSLDLSGGDITADLEAGIPLPNGSVGVVRAHDALEHVKNQQLLMSEIHRVLAPGGMLLSQTPSTDGRGAWQDPTHVSFWNQNSFYYYTRPEQAKYIRNNKLFRECKLKTEFPNQYCRDNNIPYVIAHLEKI